MEQVDFKEFSKIHRLYRDIIILEKIDGTNAQIYIQTTGLRMNAKGELETFHLEEPVFKVGSRTRWITPENDNFGFAKWAYENKTELLKLGDGRHYGEWWGNGIQRGYGQPKGVRTFSLFNVSRWHSSSPKYQGRPEACSVVPILYQGPFSEKVIQECLDDLRTNGSKVAPFLDPEGIVVYHTQSNTGWKITLDGDGHKGVKE